MGNFDWVKGVCDAARKRSALVKCPGCGVGGTAGDVCPPFGASYPIENYNCGSEKVDGDFKQSDNCKKELCCDDHGGTY